MRKSLSVILAFILAFAMCEPLLAAQEDKITNTSNSVLAPIKVSYDLKSAEIEEVYYVNISWGSFENTYRTNDKKIWNPETLTFDIESGNPEWISANGANSITVSNHSNVPVNVLLYYVPTASHTDIKGSFDNGMISLDAPIENSAYDTAPTGVSTLTVSGTLNDQRFEERIKIGTVSIKLIGESEGSVGTKDDETSYQLYQQSNDLYIAYFTATKDAPSSDTMINIGEKTYYINESHYERLDGDNAFTVYSGDTVNIVEGSENKVDAYMKMLDLKKGSSYCLVVNLKNMTLTLTKQ